MIELSTKNRTGIPFMIAIAIWYVQTDDYNSCSCGIVKGASLKQ